MTIEDLFKNSFVLSVDDVMLNTFYKRMQVENLPLPLYIDGIRKSSKIIVDKCGGVTAGHFCAVSMAKTLNLPYILMFEDDAMPCIGCRRLLEKIISQIPDEADLVKLGGRVRKTLCDWGDRNFIQDITWWSHAYIIYRKYYATWLDIVSNEFSVVDENVYNYQTNSTNNAEIYSTKEFLFTQSDSRRVGQYRRDIVGLWNKFFINPVSEPTQDDIIKLNILKNRKADFVLDK